MWTLDIVVKAARRGQKVNFNKIKQKKNSKPRLSCSYHIKFECFYFLLFIRAITKGYGKEGKNHIENQN
jgi:hypothetical protein